MFTTSLKPGDVELSVAGDDLYCDLGLYLSAMVGFVLMCILVWFAFIMLILHSISVINIFNNLTVTDKALSQIYWSLRDFTDFFSECSSINDEISFNPFSVTIIHFVI